LEVKSIRVLSVIAAVAISFVLLLGAVMVGLEGTRFMALNYQKWWWIPVLTGVTLLQASIGLWNYRRRTARAAEVRSGS
jgi:ABC-type Co2+ transport system permease subunit